MKLGLAALALTVVLPCAPFTFCQSSNVAASHSTDKTTTPIKHVVVIFGENISFDHYFGSYPNAANLPGERPFLAAWNTPKVNGFTHTLLTHNPNLNSQNGDGATNPFRLSRKQASTNDQDNDYSPEQQAFDGGKLDLFPEFTGAGGNALGNTVSNAPTPFNTDGLALAYYDGNTVTALWNYAQHYAMSDNYFETTFGDSTLGAINLVSGQTNGIVDLINPDDEEIDGGHGSLTLIGEPDPLGDVCSDPTEAQASLGGKILATCSIALASPGDGFQAALISQS